MRKDAQAATHVQLPDDVGRRVVLEGLIPKRTVVLAIAETLCVEGAELALGGDVEESVPVHIGRARRRRQQELSQSPLDSRGYVLPKETAVLRVECEENARFFREGGVPVPGVVGADIDRIADDHGTTERVVSQIDAPDDVPAGGRVPVDRRVPRLDDWSGEP
jgi:hypothetical protein